MQKYKTYRGKIVLKEQQDYNSLDDFEKTTIQYLYDLDPTFQEKTGSCNNKIWVQPQKPWICYKRLFDGL